VRYLLADEVGLGKTIEAGLILRQLKLRGLVRRALVIAPKGLVAQWVSEMRTHFTAIEKRRSRFCSRSGSLPRELMLFRDDGLAHLNQLPLTDHLAVHSGMTIAVYPFVGVVAETVGRLLRLQGSCAAAQVQRRVREQLGERETVARAARRVLRCFMDWGVLQEAKEKGVYHAVPVRSVTDKKLAAWLIEATLLVNGSNVAPLKAVMQTPMLFPLSIGPLGMGDLEGHDRLEWFRQGLDEEMVILRSRGSVR
jgi:SNF2-related domain